jgi:hypothetical protein
MGHNISEIGGDIFVDNKKEIIVEIKSIIDTFGGFSDAEVGAEASPSIETKGNLTHLCEDFNKEYVKVRVYWGKMGDDSIDSYNLSYEELENDTLQEILELAEIWETQNS